jgi:transposase
VEIVGGRRRWTVEQKLEMLVDAFEPGGSVGSACDRHRVGSGQLYTWRRQAMNGELTGLRSASLSVTEPAFAEVALNIDPVCRPAISPAQSGLIGIELPMGVKLTVDAAVDGDALARVLSVLGR